MKNILIASMIAISSQAAIAEESFCDRLLFGGWSYHYDRSKGYNENHQIVGIQCKNVSVMRFKNSGGNTSIGVGYEYMPFDYKGFEFGGYGGLWTGYKKWPIAKPVAGARVRYNAGPAAIVTTIGPDVTAIHLEFKF